MAPDRHVVIASRRIGAGEPCFVIAEAGVNHNGDLNLARKLIDAAVTAGADAVKFQTFSADRLASATAPKAAYQKRATHADETQHAMLKRLELSADMHRALMKHCRERGIIFLSSPFDEAAANLLEELDVPAYKIPSGEIVNLPFLRHVASKRRPIILSSGMADLTEVIGAVAAIAQGGQGDIVLLHCLSSYPATPAEANLRAMATMAEACGLPVGFSDHTLGIVVALAAAALGACAIEKHLTLDCKLPGPDHAASLEPEEFARMITGIRTVESALGDGDKRVQPSELETRAVARKSVVVARDLTAGDVLAPADLVSLRPGTGLSPALTGQLVGRRLLHDVTAGTPLKWDMLE
jgi:N,N'-diacetyllegionaminate synthase